jgi:hypothetical protein
VVRPVWAITVGESPTITLKRREYIDEDKGVRRNQSEAPQQWTHSVEEANEESEESPSQICRSNESEPS